MQESSALQKKEHASLDLAKYPSWLQVSHPDFWLINVITLRCFFEHGLPERKSPI